MGRYRIGITTVLFATLFFCVLLEGCSPVTKMGGGVFYEEQKSIEYSHEWIDLHVKNDKFKGLTSEDIKAVAYVILTTPPVGLSATILATLHALWHLLPLITDCW